MEEKTKTAPTPEAQGRQEQIIRNGFGPLECLNHAGAIMMFLGMELWKCDEKDQITITRDPKKGEYTIKQEAVP